MNEELPIEEYFNRLKYTENGEEYADMARYKDLEGFIDVLNDYRRMWKEKLPNFTEYELIKIFNHFHRLKEHLFFNSSYKYIGFLEYLKQQIAMGKIVRHNEKNLPTLKNGSKGYWVLLNGEDVMGGFDSITLDEFNEKRKAYFKSLTVDEIKAMCEEVLERKREEIRQKIKEFQADIKLPTKDNLDGYLYELRLVNILQNIRFVRKSSPFEFAALSDWSEEEVAKAKEIDNAQRKIEHIKKAGHNTSIEQTISEAEKYIENDVWTAAQIVGIEKNNFSISIVGLSEEEKANIPINLIGLMQLGGEQGKNYVYAANLLTKEGKL